MRVAAAVILSVFSLFNSMTSALFASAPDSTLVLVNRDNKLDSDYVPGSLVLPEVEPAPGKEDAVYLRPEAARALERLFIAADNAGYHLFAVSGYRSYKLQHSLYQRKVEAVGEEQAMLSVAPPGASEHQLGLAMDINGETTLSQGLEESFGHSPEGIWISENAHLHGFIVRYQQDQTHITGYVWEPWHLRYVGEAAAAEIYKEGITFEEYHQRLRLRSLEMWVLELPE